MRTSATIAVTLALTALCAGCGGGTPAGPASATPSRPASSQASSAPPSSQQGAPASVPEQLKGIWVVVEAAPQALVPGKEPRLSLDGNVIGVQPGCNTAGGDLAVTADQLVVNRLTATRMACSEEGVMAQESWFTRLLEADPRWRLEGDRLVLTAGDQRAVLRRA